MTAPDLTSLIPLKYKTWVAAISTVLTVVVPYVLQAVVYLPGPWPAVVGGVIGALGIFGVYRAPYAPEGTELTPKAIEAPAVVPTGTVLDGLISVVPGECLNPWKPKP